MPRTAFWLFLDFEMKKGKHLTTEQRLYHYDTLASVMPQTYRNTAAFAWEEIQ
jgi:hypothetical protein